MLSYKFLANDVLYIPYSTSKTYSSVAGIPSTWECGQGFSAIMNIKSKSRNRLTLTSHDFRCAVRTVAFRINQLVQDATITLNNTVIFKLSSSSSFEGHPLQARHKQNWGRGFILLLPQTAALPGSNAGSDVIKPASSFVIQNRQTSCSMWCPMYGAHC